MFTFPPSSDSRAANSSMAKKQIILLNEELYERLIKLIMTLPSYAMFSRNLLACPIALCSDEAFKRMNLPLNCTDCDFAIAFDCESRDFCCGVLIKCSARFFCYNFAGFVEEWTRDRVLFPCPSNRTERKKRKSSTKLLSCVRSQRLARWKNWVAARWFLFARAAGILLIAPRREENIWAFLTSALSISWSL